jgi:hypothetical protein
MVFDGRQVDYFSSPNKWTNKGGQQYDCAHPAHVQLQASTYME